MKLEITETHNILLKEVFNSVVFETKEGEKIAVCMRDGGFEIGIKDQSAKSKDKEEFYSWYRIMNGDIQPLIGETETVIDPDSVSPGKPGEI